MKFWVFTINALCATVAAASAVAKGNMTEGLLQRTLTKREDSDTFYIKLVSNKLVSTNRHLCLTFDPTDPRHARLEKECNFDDDSQAWFHDDLGRLRSPHLPGYCLAVDKNHHKLLLYMMKCSNTRSTQRWSYKNRRLESAYQKSKPWCMDHYRSYGNAVHLMSCSATDVYDHDQLFDLIECKLGNTKAPNGEYCSHDSDCMSHNCFCNICHPQVSGPGGSCTSDDECLDKACGRIYGGSLGSICCESGQTTIFDRVAYCTDRPNGSNCATSSMCLPGDYCNDAGFCSRELSGPGEPCYDDYDCQKHAACAFQYERDSDSDQMVCCESGVTTVFRGKDYCSYIRDGNDCATSSMCSSGSYCDTQGTCQPSPSEPGEPCYADGECHSKACGLMFGMEDDGLVCCNDGYTVLYPGDHPYCTDLPDGSPCGSDDLCASGYCDGSICRAPLAEAGEDCNDNSDCINQSCGIRYGSGDSTSPICCRTGEITFYAGDWYCAGRPNNRPCASNEMCASFYCNDVKGICSAALSGPGDACTYDDECLDQACGQIYGENSGSICCESGQTTIFDRVAYCTDRPNGSNCATSAICVSGDYCNDAGICSRELSGPGEPCYDDGDCQNQAACGFLYESDAEMMICCHSGRTTPFGGVEFCSGLPDGSHCATGIMCSSGFCDRYGVCGPRLAEPGESCANDDDCNNSACGHLPSSRGGKICCFSGETKLIGVRVTCTGSPDGYRCSADHTCASGFCSSRGVCSPASGCPPTADQYH